MNIEDFGPFTLSAGAHESPSNGMCVMEMVAFLSGEDWTDTPQCACPVIGRFAQVLNDRFDQEDRDRLQLFVPRLIGSRSPEHELDRAEFLAWQAIRVFAPFALEAAGMNKEAQSLRNFGGSLARASSAASEASEAASAARASSAARAAARASEAASAARASSAARAARAARAAAYAASIAAVDASAVFQSLDSVLRIGPSGERLTPDQAARAPALREAVSA